MWMFQLYDYACLRRLKMYMQDRPTEYAFYHVQSNVTNKTQPGEFRMDPDWTFSNCDDTAVDQQASVELDT